MSGVYAKPMKDKQAIADFIQQDMSLGEKILQMFDAVLDKLHEIIGTTHNTRATQMVDDLETARNMWFELLEEARENAGKNGIDRKDYGPNVWMSKTENEDTPSLKQQLENSMDRIKELDVVADIHTKGRGDDRKFTDRLKKRILEKYREKYEQYIHRDGLGDVKIDGNQIKIALRHASTDGQYAAIYAAPEIIKKGIEIGESLKHKGNDEDTWTYAAPIRVNGDSALSAAVVKLVRQGYYYKCSEIIAPDGSVFEFKEEQVPSTGGGVAAVAPKLNTYSSDNTISIEKQSVNTENRASRRSTMDQREYDEDINGIKVKGKGEHVSVTFGDGEYSTADMRKLYSMLDPATDADTVEIAEKVFAFCEEHGIRFKGNIGENDPNKVKQANGYYQGDLVRLNDIQDFNFENVPSSQKAKTILHESLHAATVYALELYSRQTTYFLTSEQIEACKQLNEIYDQLKNDRSVKGYGMKNVKEMVSEVFANKDFRDAVAGKKTGILQRIVSAIKNLLGIKSTSSVDRYSDAKDAIYRLIENEREDQGGFKRYMGIAKDGMRQAGNADFELMDGENRASRRSSSLMELNSESESINDQIKEIENSEEYSNLITAVVDGEEGAIEAYEKWLNESGYGELKKKQASMPEAAQKPVDNLRLAKGHTFRDVIRNPDKFGKAGNGPCRLCDENAAAYSGRARHRYHNTAITEQKNRPHIVEPAFGSGNLIRTDDTPGMNRML